MRALPVLALIGLAVACTTTAEKSALPAGPLSQAFQTSALTADVPRDLLVAIAKVEDGLSMPALREDLDEDNDVPVAGPLQLRRGKLDTLKRGAELVSVTELDLRKDTDLALRAGARVLAEIGQRAHASSDLTTWREAIEEMSGFADAAHRESYAHKVFATLARGGSFEGRDGETIELTAHPELPPSLTLEIDTRLHPLAGEAQYAGADWIPTSCTSKCSPTREGAKVEFIVIHDTEGGWNASVATLQNDPNKSVQYIIGEDGKVAQFVTEETTAWHAGNIHYNQRSVGIEHVGYATKPFPEAEYEASAKLVDYLARKYKVPRDRAHIIGHDQIPNGKAIEISSAACADSPKKCQSNTNYGGASHHTDPGVWEWPTFMWKFGGTSKCNDVTAIWNCSKSKKQKFRCIDGKVEVASCTDTCAVKELGVDDVCQVDPTAKPPMSGDNDEPGPGSTDPQTEDGQENDESTPGSSSSKKNNTTKSASSTAEGGCNSPGRSTGSPWGALGLGLVVYSIHEARLRRARSRSRADRFRSL